MSKIRLNLIAGSIGGLVFFNAALYLTAELGPNLISIIMLQASIIAFGVMIWMTGWILAKTLRKNRGKTLKSMNWLLVVASFFAVSLLVVAPMFAMNWGVGASIRAWSLWSFLPVGNLLWAGGSSGWIALIYLTLVSTLLVSYLWNHITVLPGKIKQSFKYIPTVPMLMNASEQSNDTTIQWAPRPNEEVEVIDEEVNPTKEFLAKFR